jgi:hypothetical protein
MAPADVLLLASSNDQGSAYIQMSSIEGETNLKLHISPRLPKHVMEQLNTPGQWRISIRRKSA